ncbi:MAG: biosynthetic-type acetolactate synthase large subunit [Clostridium sp.]|jgi:acetolactate synthase-1/2/3 large subunit|uniref:biosynthetic-type acetolactate synthase large subunit n=1 Tax=Clostridium sp. TaxID=1506 RepID=UPI0025BC144D|nr:biosynthetic-type acetolactate synthase large subunit [Clostridium sp.]MCH3963781.1 biosynthetic-type acetolactate synthase large subunit [Clostridium sp.]MCI1714922.1 biosynthetic-type acetolactate synthase large subunit [Clostridium sp.]MCI1798889.1 biosynthetic-type acetolactate synthase large subunit [Clostridium sp.]MCI1813105.1 biosynthetic-type acetolactate synthase large subunit [Clostridium sp.]MCI1869995.1 biosynthetic-type acetolactate synthase large subunit [Clostridium sp.]
MKGAEMLLKCLVKHKVDTIFGYPGGAVLPIYDALYDMQDELNHIITAHEQGAAHAADGYARSTGKVGVVIATSGPGATNTVTGIATAYMDSIPIIVFAGQVSTSMIGKNSFQEVNIRSITKSITKKTFTIDKASDIENIIDEAFKIAVSGRKGPVVVEIPKNIQTSEASDNTSELGNVSSTSKNEEFKYDLFSNEYEDSIDKVVNIIKCSKKPMIYAGGGVISSGAEKQLVEFVDKLDTPIACSLMGIGAFPGDRKNYTGMVGMHGSHCSNYAVSECDLLIAIGARFSDRVISKVSTFARKSKIIHIDIDRREFGKNVDITMSVRGDIKKVLSDLTGKLEKQNHGEWMKCILKLKENEELKYSNFNHKEGKYLDPRDVINTLYRLTGGDCIITTEVGQNQIWTAQYFKFLKSRTFITSGGLGTMGFGLGAAIGACIGNPNERVINVAGDGSFKMNSTELATIAKYRLPIIQLVLNNRSLGMVHQWQEMFYKKRYCFTELTEDVDFVKLGEAYGIKSLRIEKSSELENCLKIALKGKEPMIIECNINIDEKVFPIVPPGASISESIG